MSRRCDRGALGAGRLRFAGGMTEQDRSSAPDAPAGWRLRDRVAPPVTTAATRTAPRATGWTVRPHGSVGPRRLASFGTMAVSSGASVTMVMTPAVRTMIGNAPSPSPGWRVRVRETSPAPPPTPAAVGTAVVGHPAEGHLAGRVVVAAVGATVLVTVAAHLHGSAPGLQPITPGRIATAPPRVAPPPARLSAPPPNLYRVVAGDSMSAIAARNGISLIDLARANPQVHNLGLIHIGDLLRLA